MKTLQWFERQFNFGLPKSMLPFYLERLEGTIARMEAKVNGVPEDLLAIQLNNKWSIKQNIGHLAEVDGIAIKRLGEMVAGVSPMSPAVFEPRSDYNAQPVQSTLQFFRENRIKNLEAYKKLSDSDLEKASLHPRLNVVMTPVDLAWFDAEHDDHHLVKINEILKQLH